MYILIPLMLVTYECETLKAHILTDILEVDENYAQGTIIDSSDNVTQSKRAASAREGIGKMDCVMRSPLILAIASSRLSCAEIEMFQYALFCPVKHNLMNTSAGNVAMNRRASSGRS